MPSSTSEVMILQASLLCLPPTSLTMTAVGSIARLYGDTCWKESIWQLDWSAIDKRHYHTLEKPFCSTSVQQDNHGREVGLMPAKTQGLLRIPEIIAMLETFDVPVVDRP